MHGGKLKVFLNGCAEALFPRFCFSCKAEGALLCASCCSLWQPDIQENRSEKRFSFGKYVDPIWRQLIGAWKYDFDESAFDILALQMQKSEDECKRFCENEAFEALVPLRLFARKERERGFDQSVKLANMIAGLVQVPVLDGLRRIRSTGKQADRTDEERKNAMQKSPFIWVLGDVPERVALIDDVYTTGATANAAKEVLIAHGAKSVSIITVAQGR